MKLLLELSCHRTSQCAGQEAIRQTSMFRFGILPFAVLSFGHYIVQSMTMLSLELVSAMLSPERNDRQKAHIGCHINIFVTQRRAWARHDLSIPRNTTLIRLFEQLGIAQERGRRPAVSRGLCGGREQKAAHQARAGVCCG